MHRLCGLRSGVPVNAIYAEEDLPPKFSAFVQLNARLALSLATITKKKPPLPYAEQWRAVSHKLSSLDTAP